MSALAASLCCLGPLVAAVLGIGGFAASSWFAAWRPYFLAASFGLLALAWYLTYRRAPGTCADGESCAPAAGRKGAKIFLWVVTALAIPAALFPSLLSLGGTSLATATKADGTELRVRIPSMDCVACAKGIEATLRRTPGVIHATVDYDTKNAVIVFDPQRTTAAELIATIDRTGFKAEKISQTSTNASSGAVAKADACCAPENKTAATMASVAAERRTMNPERISLFTVPLVCPAAPEIGCGSRAKPILTKLETAGSITEAWLNSAGTILAVVGSESSSRESRAKAVHEVFAAGDHPVAEIAGGTRQAALDEFLSGAGWHRGAAVDDLSRQEAGIIAARLVRRLQARIPLAAEKSKTLEGRIAAVFTRRFTGEKDESRQAINDRGWNEELVGLAGSELTPSELAAFREALVPGYRPQLGEK